MGRGAVDAGGSVARRLLLLLDDAFAHVLLQRRRDGEGHLAEAAPVHVLPEAPVRLHVARQLRALGARVAAQLALVRLLPLHIPQSNIS